MAKLVQKAGNPFWPLPPDYPELTLDGQRLARLNACRMWTIPNLDDAVLADVYVGGLTFFDQYYLWPDEKLDFDPQFYKEPPLRTPDFHKLMAAHSITSWLSLDICPRGSGKTMENRKEIVFELISRPGYEEVYCTSTQSNVKVSGDEIRAQFIHNDRIFDDWAPEYGDRIFPKRSEAPQSATHFKLTNGSMFRGISAKTRMRGMRPNVFRLDDPEFDPAASTSMPELRRTMETLVFTIAMPAVTKAGARLVWRATIISKRHFSWSAMEGEWRDDRRGGKVFVATDDRFNMWHRMQIVAERQRTDGVMESVWEEMWPITKARRLQLAESDGRYKKVRSLEEIRAAIGPASFNAEYLARPGDASVAYFGLLSKEKHGYWFENVDEHLQEQPWKSNTLLCWYERTGEANNLRKMPLKEFYLYARFFQTGDTSFTTTATSDFKATVVMAITPNNDLFIFDLWNKRGRQEELIEASFALNNRWRTASIHVDAIREGLSYYEGLLSMVATKAKDMAGSEYLPAIKKVQRGMAAKEGFISGLLFRFDHGKIKFPLDKRKAKYWVNLFDQIESFNPDAENGGLANDDLLDCVAMSIPVLKTRLGKPMTPEQDTRTPMQKLKDGELQDKLGMPIALQVDWRKAPLNEVNEILSRNEQRRFEQDQYRESVI